MAGIEGPFTPIKFCGAKVTRIQSSAGWEEQVSRLRVDLVEDPITRDRFVPPEPGTPLSFTFENFRFDGLVQRWDSGRSPSGNPVYSVELYSPAEILEATQLILDAYRGVNLLCPNLLNVFGYLEGAGDSFGGSSRNESGIPWYKIRQAIEAIQIGETDFSPGIEFKGHRYIVDLGAVPIVPDFYRIGGTFISLNQAIQTVFQDAGYSFMVYLQKSDGNGPHTISFKSRSRLVQEPLGQVASFVEGKENVVSFSEGAELRNDITCGVILGGEEESCIPMYETGNGATIWQFWGYQQTPLLIPFGVEGNQPVVESFGYGNNHIAYLNSTPIADIIGSTIYDCSAFEMRLAMVDFDSWSVFIARKRPEMASVLGLDAFPSIFGRQDFHMNPQSMYARDISGVGFLSNPYAENYAMSNLNRIYDFVRSQAQAYMGKQFMVRIPFWLKYYFEEETNKLLYNVTINTDGYFPDYVGGWNSGPLGLNYENFNHFMTDSGKFTPFVKFSGPDMIYANLAAMDNSNVVIQNSEVFVRAQIDQRIIFTPQPAALCEVPDALWSVWADPVGGINDIAWLLDMDPIYLRNVLIMNNGEFPVRIHPWPFSPSGVTVCIKNHEYTYGPWTKIGVAGKVKIEQDAGLVPWNYGSFETMRLAAEAQLADIGATAQVEESGSVEFPGAPDISLGDQLNGVGPVVTSIDVTISDDQGVRTNYMMRSQTPVYGAFSKQNADRLRRLGSMTQDMRRNMRAFADRIRFHNNIISQARFAFMQNVSRAIKHNQATNVFQTFIVVDPNSGAVLSQSSSQSFAAAIGSSNAHNPEMYKATASMGMEGLMRPFSTKVDHEVMPHYEPDAISPVKNTDLDPFQEGSDIMWVASGSNFNGYYTGNEDIDRTDVRGMGLRGPMVMVGWGRDMAGKPVPNSNEESNLSQDMTDEYLADYLTQFNKWKTGPVDLRWDQWRKVWSMPSILVGEFQTGNKIKVKGTEDLIDVEDYLGGTLTHGRKIIAGYFPLDNKWYIIATAC